MHAHRLDGYSNNEVPAHTHMGKRPNLLPIRLRLDDAAAFTVLGCGRWCPWTHRWIHFWGFFSTLWRALKDIKRQRKTRHFWGPLLGGDIRHRDLAPPLW
jgi:hypothetical protein